MTGLTNLDDVMAEQLGSLRLSRQDFDVVRTIGRGHFGEVHVVRDKHSNVYAMKTLRKVDMLAQENVSTVVCSGFGHTCIEETFI